MYSLKMSVSRGPWMACDEKMCAPVIFSPANAFPCFLQWFWSRPHPRPHIRSSQPCDQDQDDLECSPCKVGRPWLVHTAEGSRHTGPGSIFIININVLAIIEQHYCQLHPHSEKELRPQQVQVCEGEVDEGQTWAWIHPPDQKMIHFSSNLTLC